MTRPANHPIEIVLSSGLVLRGLEYSQNGPPVVLVHDVGDDADSWRQVPRELVARGFRVMSLELRGHGLSDGDPDPVAAIGDIPEAVGIVSGSFGPVGLVSYGSTATAALSLGPDDGCPVQILVSPLPDEEFSPRDAVPAMRALFAGTKDHPADTFIRSIYQSLPGQNMWFSTGMDERGIDLLASNPAMVEQMAMFLRRYLVGHHLAWIAEHQTSDEGNDADRRQGPSTRAAGQ